MESWVFQALFASPLAPALEGMAEFLVAADHEEPRIALALLFGAASMRVLMSILFRVLGASDRA